jgi:hypothetical protein
MQAVLAIARAPIRRGIVLGALLVAAACATLFLAYGPYAEYYPVVKIAAPGGVTFTALLDAKRGLKACTATNAEFLDPLLGECPDCEVLFAQCLEKSQALGLTLEAREAARQYWVVSQGVTIAVGGAETMAKASCEAVAADLASRGMHSRCIHPSPINRI